MNTDTLDAGVARSQAREAREARRAGHDAPSYHLGGPPEAWEEDIGDIGERVGRQGRGVVEYAAKMKAMGIDERSLAGNNNPIADHVATMGRDKLRLLPGVPAASTGIAAAVEGAPSPDAVVEEDESMSVSSDWSDVSDENEATRSQARKDADKNAAGARSDPGEAEDEPSDEIDLIDDPEIRNAVEDFDSRNWTMEQLEVSCQTLLEECYASEDRRRRLLSAGMLRKLVEIYPSALRWMQRSLEAVVNDALPGMVKGILDARVFKLDILLGILAPAMAETMTQLNVVARVLRLMVYRMDTAVRVISFRCTYPKWLAKYRELPGAIATHRRMTLMMQGAELRARWRRVNADEKHGSLPASVLHAYLCIILALIDTDTCPKCCRMNRVKVVGACGLLALGVHFKAGDRSQRLACRILRELAREPLLIFELLNAGVAEYLSRLLPKLRMTSVDRLLEALDAVDSMAFSAMRFCELSHANPNRGQGNSDLVAALVADGSSIGGLESEIRIPNGDKVEEIVRAQLGLPNLVAMLTGLLGETDVQLYLAGVVILGKLATTVCYHSVLQEMLAYAGRALELLVEGLQSQEPLVPDMSLAFFLQLCSRQEGRDGIEATDGIAMLQPLISGSQAQDSPVFLRGLACAIAIARQGYPGSAPGYTGEGVTPSATAPPGLSLPRAGGVGRSGPAKPHPLDIEGKLYNDIVEILDAPPPAPLRAVRGLVRMGSLEAVMRFLVREDDEDGGGVADNDGSVLTSGGIGADPGGRTKKPSGVPRGPHYFRLKQRHACLGAVVLHGLAVLAGPHPAIMTGSTLRYLCYSIQVAYIDLTVGKLAPGVGYPLMFQSIQLACRALAFLATSDGAGVASETEAGGEGRLVEVGDAYKEGDQGGAVDHGPLRRVADSLISTTAINEVACMAQMPSRAAWTGDEGFMYRHLERTVSSAAILVAGVCPVPAGERDPFTRFDEPEDEQSSLRLCQPLMERLVTTLGGSLCSTLMVAESLEIIAHTCRALAKLSESNTTIQMLLDSHDIMKAIIRLGPRAPAVLPANAQAGAQETLRDESLSPDRPSRTHGDGDTPPSRTRETAKRSTTRGGQVQPTVAAKKGTAMASSSTRSDGDRAEGESRRSGERRDRVDPTRDRGGLGDGGESCAAAQLLWGGYDVQEGNIADASTRKLCSLPFDYFRLVANVARVPSGRAIVQSSGTLKRCLERMALNVSGCPAAQLATLRCRSEICVLIGRMAGTYDRKTGAANEFILSHRYQTVRVLLEMLGAPPEAGRPFGATRMQMELARHNAAYALAEICRDTMRSVPLVADAGGIHLACRVANDLMSPIPLLKQVLRILQGAGSFPDGVYASLIADPAVLRSLNRIANNAYPGFRPTTSGGEARPSSSASERKRPKTPPVPERGGTRIAGRDGGAKANGQGRVSPPALAFNLVKPCSPESRLISELATEVAYLVGTSARRSLSKTPPSPPRRKEQTPLAAQPRERLPTATEPAQTTAREKNAPQGARTDLGPASPTGQTAAAESGGYDARAGGEQDNVVMPVKPGGRVVGVVTGRPGTYLGCGVTSCKGLGFVGGHGDVAGNAPHGAFVLREADNGHGGDENAPSDNSTRDASGVTPGRDGAGTDVEKAPDKHDTERSATAAPEVVVATPLALLSAREPSFRNDLIRRKEHYSLGGTRQKVGTSGDENGGESPLDEAISELDKRKTHSGPFVVVQRGRSTKPLRRPRTSRQQGSSSPAPVDISESPLMASTRPTGAPPALESRRADPTRQNGDNPQSLRGKCSRPEGKEFVTFARPAAHWSVTKSLSTSPGRVRSKGVRVPKGASDGRGGGLVVGRFACRGYLLDPTFSDHNPVILHPRLPLIVGGGGGFSQVPEGSTLAELVPSPGGKVCPIGGGVGTRVEPYRNIVEVLRHNVGVSGGRAAGKKG